jgi:hypothetical protein
MRGLPDIDATAEGVERGVAPADGEFSRTQHDDQR